MKIKSLNSNWIIVVMLRFYNLLLKLIYYIHNTKWIKNINIKNWKFVNKKKQNSKKHFKHWVLLFSNTKKKNDFLSFLKIKLFYAIRKSSTKKKLKK